MLSCNVGFSSFDFVRKSNEFSILFFNKAIPSSSIKDTSNFGICPALIQNQGGALYSASGNENLKKSFFLESDNLDFYKQFSAPFKVRENGRFALESVIFSRRFLPLKKSFSEVLKNFSLSADSYNPELKDVAAIKISQWFDWVSFGAQKEVFKPEDVAQNADLMLVSSATFNFDNLLLDAPSTLKFTFKNGKEVEKRAGVYSRGVAVAQFKDFDASFLKVEGADYSIIFLKPKELERAKTLLSKIDAESFENAFNVLKMLVNTEVSQVVVPRFKLNMGLLNLNSIIQNLGAGEIFEAQQYPKFSENKLKVGNVFQTPSFSIYPNAENGKASNPATKILVLDKPFAVAVCEFTTGRIIFLGAVENPKKN